ncbi:MAG TPA: ribonuclease P protein component [Spirochaetia bacterium]|nr:ribonuclease P protein component [Spirochaetia bacterium]
MSSFTTVKSNRDFRACYRKGRTARSRQLVLYYRRRKGPEVRFGFVVSKKVGGAVQRNRVRRVLREACRLNSHLFAPGFDYVFVARPECVTLGLAQAENIVLGLLKSF